MTGELGRCMTCMRTAFMCAAGAWLASGFATLFLPPAIAVAAWGIAAGLTALWIAHAWMFTRRSYRATAIRASGRSITQQQGEL
jgi:hypothetical protein